MPAGRYFRQSVVFAWIQGNATPTPPTSVWVHLATSAPSATAVGTAPTKGGYAPFQITASDWAAIVEAADNDTLNPDVQVRFPPTGTFSGGSDQSATHIMVRTSSNPAAGQMIAYGTLGASRLMTDGGVVTLEASDLDLLA